MSSELFLSYFTSAGRRPHEWNNEKITKNSRETSPRNLVFPFVGLVITRVKVHEIRRHVNKSNLLFKIFYYLFFKYTVYPHCIYGVVKIIQGHNQLSCEHNRTVYMVWLKSYKRITSWAVTITAHSNHHTNRLLGTVHFSVLPRTAFL